MIFTPTHWQKVLSYIKTKAKYTPREFTYWFSRLEPLFNGNPEHLNISCPNKLVAEELQSKYKATFEKIIFNITNKKINIDFVLSDQAAKYETDKIANNATKEISIKTSIENIRMKRANNKMPNNLKKPKGVREIMIPQVYSPVFEIPKILPVSKFRFDNFCVDGSNEMAFTAAKTVAKSTGSYNPLYIYSDHGKGKTHLLHAIFNKAIENRDKKCVLISAAQFSQTYLNAVEDNKVLEFSHFFKNADILLIDDIDFLVEHKSCIKELCSILKTMLSEQKQIVVTSNLLPVELNKMKTELKNILLSGLSACMQLPEYQMRLEILKLKSFEMNFEFSDDVLDFIADNFCASPRKLEGIIKKIAIHQQIKGRLTVEDVQEIYNMELTHQRKTRENLSVKTIINCVSKAMGISSADMVSKKRGKEILQARQISMYLSRKLIDVTLGEIGSQFGGRDHSTVLHATNKIEAIVKKQEPSTIKSQVKQILKKLKISFETIA